MGRRLVIGLLVLGAWVGAATPATSAGAEAPAAVSACGDEGWRALSNADGHPFRNQGQCIRALLGSDDQLASLVGAFEGGSYVFLTPTCEFAGQNLYATYTPDGGDGTVQLGMGGCLIADPATNTGTFTGEFLIESPTGSVSGTVSGTITGAFTTSTTYDLSLTAGSGTGSLEGASGHLRVEIQWSWNGLAEPITGTVSAP